MFSWADHHAVDPAAADWDVVVVGAGMGGAFCGLALAQQGKRVLFLERGPVPDPSARSTSRRWQRLFSSESREADLRRRGRWNKPVVTSIDGRGKSITIPMGNGPGGSSAVYGAALERFLRMDFCGAPGESANSADFPDRWPISYDAFIPYYQRAEAMLRVCGSRDPLDPDDNGILSAPPALSERDAWLFDKFEGAGLDPFRLHVGIDYRPGCMECLGQLCPRDCKSEGSSRALKPALSLHGARIVTGFTVDRLICDKGIVTAVAGMSSGKPAIVRAGLVILAGGALSTPGLLLNSSDQSWPRGIGNDHDLVGRGLMFHLFQIFTIRAPKNRSSIGPGKTISSRSLYLVDGKRLGSIQSFAWRVEPAHVAQYISEIFSTRLELVNSLTQSSAKIAARFIQKFFEDDAIFVAQTEDFAFKHNRVTLDQESPSGYRIEYRLPDDLKARSKFFRSEIRRRLTGLKARFISTGAQINFGHPSGTCRMGDDPAASVVDPDGKIWGMENLYVVDASVFPTCAAINPSLTVAANALRVADIITRREREVGKENPELSTVSPGWIRG